MGCFMQDIVLLTINAFAFQLQKYMSGEDKILQMRNELDW